MLPKPTAPDDPVNEPCYSHAGACGGYSPATGPAGTHSVGICCVKIGTCDGLTVVDYPHSYEGGCVPVFGNRTMAGSSFTGPVWGYNYPGYVAKESNAGGGTVGSPAPSSTSTSTLFPTATEGCVKQGECSIPQHEMIMHYTHRGGGLETVALSNAVMDRLLHNAAESYPEACRASDLYPRMAVTATHHVTATITIAVCISPTAPWPRSP